MNKIKVTDLEAGMQFSAPVYLDDDSLLVPEGVQIRDKDIQRLMRWGIETVSTEGILQKDKTFITGGDEELGSLDTIYYSTVEGLDGVFDLIRKGQKIKAAEIDKTISDLLRHVLTEPENLMAHITRVDDQETSLGRSAVNCMILASMIGQRMKMVSHKLIQLAIAALLHDIGMTRIPVTILKKSGNLSDEELQIIRTHTLHSYRIIIKEIGYPEEIASIVLHHHERWDGKGYPKQLKKEEIPLSSRIITVVDAFEAMMRSRPYRESLIGYSAVRQILNDNFRRFDAEIIKIFIKCMGIYPVGSIVVMNDGSIAKVIKSHKDVPMRPVVKILVGKDGFKQKSKSSKDLDLMDERSFFIIRAINPKDVKESQ